ncbi:MAG: hypothetical protein ACK4OJ_14460, partial [Brevundimonas sp.]
MFLFLFGRRSLSWRQANDAGTARPEDRPMIERRPFESLGGANHGWLNAKHHFSFANYYDPKRMSWGNLRVWNDDE